MYCSVSAVKWPTETEDAKLLLLYSGTDEEEACQVARDACAEGIYAKVVAKAIGGVHLFHYCAPSFSRKTAGKTASPASPA